jgi:anthranilate phosphoribosyltransferase
MSSVRAALAQLIEGNSLSAAHMRAAMLEIMRGEASPAALAGFLVALRCKGESVEEIVAATEVLRELATPVHVSKSPLLDIVGTGGDGASIFNVSTASAFVCACAGATVAKHGNRAVSSSSGSADVLEAAGVNLEAAPERVSELIHSLGIGFLFAPKHHGAMRFAAPVRKELGLRTLFNLLGPLSNPALAPHQVLGVFSARWCEPLAHSLKALGSQHVLVVHADDGLDEFSIASASYVSELRAGEVSSYRVDPESLGLKRHSLDQLKVSDAKASLRMIEAALGGAPTPAADMIAINAGAGIYAADLVPDLRAGVEKAQSILKSGAALLKLRALAEASWP